MSTRLDTSPRTRARLARLALFGQEDHSKNSDDITQQQQLTSAYTLSSSSARATTLSSTLTAEERIDRCARNLSKFVQAVDILITSLQRVTANPHVERYRKVDVSKGVFKKEVASVPGGTELLFAVGYEPLHGHLVLQNHKPSLLNHALRALEATRQSSEYVVAKAEIADKQALVAAASAKAAEEQALRSAALAKVPPEASADDADSACQITISLYSEKLTRRRFSSENTLADLANFVRSLAQVPTSGTLRLENVTTRPPRVMDLTLEHACSLYALDLWPVGRVDVTVTA